MNAITDQQMDAAVLHAAGSPAEAIVVRPEPLPVLAAGEVLVQVQASGVNPIDVAVAAGFLGSPLPIVPGIDFAGVVVSEGELYGQEVWGSQAYLSWKRPGAHAQYVALPSTWLSRKPKNLSMVEAGAVGRPYITAWQALIKIMDLQPGETILLNGGAGLVGQAAADIARWRGARPIVAGRRPVEGAQDVIDTTAGDLTEAVLALTDGKGVDAALDAIGGELFEPTIKSLRFGGRMVGLLNNSRVEFDPTEIYSHDRHVTGLASLFIDGAEGARVFDQLAPLFERGLLTPPATKTWPLSDAARAYDTVMNGARGVKQVILPFGDAA
ncbi:MAG: zinc-binding alcohol dehydrogenase family protein [Microbacteriaceae bacterium]|nr:zinc-binding alcohol dehydrogenase family protein [Microbacteriaceae bacterium]MCL2794021.1 zinc-binding alcohol dehydrogenase family protein [Microbacteriaceae bacterium]